MMPGQSITNSPRRCTHRAQLAAIMEVVGGGRHFVLVHGLCHGAWCWYKVATALESAGHRVTALDLAAAGAHPARLHEVRSLEDYSRPLLDAVAAAPDGDRLVLVGHSHGGVSLALAMERFPSKVATAVFVAAALPCVGKHLGVTLDEVVHTSRLTHMHGCTTAIVSSFNSQIYMSKSFLKKNSIFCDDRSS
jgi:alpha-beta hydrolase superfamily lysophospholipase